MYEEVLHNFTKPGGCRELMEDCRELAEVSDPEFTGNNLTVNEVCQQATAYCLLYSISEILDLVGCSPFDLGQRLPDPCPYYVPVRNYLNQGTVLQQLGVPVNFSYDAPLINSNYGLDITSGTGDTIRIAGLKTLNVLLSEGIKVAMVFGDRDYHCNWVAAKTLTHHLSWPGSAVLHSAAYERMLKTNDTTQLRAITKQAGLLSFTRVFDAGHAVSAYAPEEVYAVFARSMFDLDVPTGQVAAGPGKHFVTKGPKSSWGWKNVLPKNGANACMVEGRFPKQNAYHVGMVY